MGGSLIKYTYMYNDNCVVWSVNDHVIHTCCANVCYRA